MTKPNSTDPESPLLGELRWLIWLRWGAGLIVILGILVNAFWVGWSSQHTVILIAGALILVYNAVLLVPLRPRFRTAQSPPALLSLAWTHILLDMSLLTVVTVWTGGLNSPLLSLFVLHLVFASLLLPPMTSYLAAVAAIAMVVLGLRLSETWPASRVEYLVLLGWVLLLLLTSFITDHITRSLRLRETELRRQHRRTKAILETAAEGIITIDERGVMLSANPAAEEIFGYSVEGLIGRNVSMLMPQADARRHDSYIADYLRSRNAKIIGIGREVEGLRADGTEIPLDLAVSEVLLGNRRTFTGIVRDITERKRAERELKQLNAELRRQQQALLQHEKMSAMGQMAAGVAHEISNPLASMDSLLELAKRKPERLKPDTVDVLRQQVDRISRIVQQMTDFAHPNETAWETVEVNAMITGALDILRFDHRLRQVEIVRELSPDSGSARIMPHAMQQVLVNIVMNAVDAIEELDSPRIEIRTSREGKWSVLEVRDNGSGIAEENLNRVLEPFFTTKPVGRGTGLGLSISYALIERQGGQLVVRSTQGDGCRVLVYLPIAPAGS